MNTGQFLHHMMLVRPQRLQVGNGTGQETGAHGQQHGG